MKEWLRWVPGRQGSGYAKLLLLRSRLPFPFDAYMLKFPVGSYVDWHVDSVPEVEGGSAWRHYRLNFFLRLPKEGGEFETQGPRIFSGLRCELFRPDIVRHRVTTVFGGTRYVLSLGWLW